MKKGLGDKIKVRFRAFSIRRKGGVVVHDERYVQSPDFPKAMNFCKHVENDYAAFLDETVGKLQEKTAWCMVNPPQNSLFRFGSIDLDKYGLDFDDGRHADAFAGFNVPGGPGTLEEHYQRYGMAIALGKKISIWDGHEVRIGKDLYVG